MTTPAQLRELLAKAPGPLSASQCMGSDEDNARLFEAAAEALPELLDALDAAEARAAAAERRVNEHGTHQGCLAVTAHFEEARDAWQARALRAEAALAAMREDMIQDEDEDNAIYQRVKKNTDAAMAAALGTCRSHLWGPALEELGRVLDAGMLRAEYADRRVREVDVELAGVRGALEEARAVLKEALVGDYVATCLHDTDPAGQRVCDFCRWRHRAAGVVLGITDCALARVLGEGKVTG